MVLMELKVAESDDIMAARKDASSKPLTPERKSVCQWISIDVSES